MGSHEAAAATASYFNNLYAWDLKADAFQNEHPQHPVWIKRPFFLGAYHVTRGQFQRFVDATGYKTDAEKDGKGGTGWSVDKFERKPEFTWRNPGFTQTDEHPVLIVSWDDAMQFCRWLSRKERAEYRLPTEAEWEYACRAGTTTRWWCGDNAEALTKVANVADATLKAASSRWKYTIRGSDGYAFTSPVGSFRPNRFGLYDMCGNAFQWCADWYDAKYYDISPTDDPKGPLGGTLRVLRGGSWSFLPASSRSSSRLHVAPGLRSAIAGFRVVRTLESSAAPRSATTKL